MEADEAIGSESDHLFDAGDLCNDGGAVAGDVILGMPHDFAGEFMEGHDAMAVGATDWGDEIVAVDERRAVIAVACGSGSGAFFADEERAEVVGVAGSPEEFAIGDGATLQFPFA